MSNYGFTITVKGRALLAKLLAGGTLEITRCMVGSGTVPAGGNPADFTNLVAPVALAASTVPTVGDLTASFVVEYRSDLNGGLETGFWINEFGIFAMDPDDGEILLYYATLGEYPQYISAYRPDVVEVRRYPVTIAIAEGTEVVLSYPALAFMTAEDVAQYVTVTALPIFRAAAQELIAVHDASEAAHPGIRNLIDNGLAGRIQRLEDMLLNDVTGNAYLITFGDLDGVVVSGVWNQAQQRIEF